MPSYDLKSQIDELRGQLNILGNFVVEGGILLTISPYFQTLAVRTVSLLDLEYRPMAEGIIKWFDNRKGWGFIADPAGDVFVHFSEIAGDGFRRLKEGDRVTYELIKSEKGLKASKVEKLESAVSEKKAEASYSGS